MKNGSGSGNQQQQSDGRSPANTPGKRGSRSGSQARPQPRRPSINVDQNPLTTVRSNSSGVSPTDTQSQSSSRTRRMKALSVLGVDEHPEDPQTLSRTHSSPTIPRDSQLATQQSPPANTGAHPGTFFNDSEFDSTPTLDSAKTRSESSSPEPTYEDYLRRQSEMSSRSAASQGSRPNYDSTPRFHKRLQGFFGDEYQGPGTRPPLERSVSPRARPPRMDSQDSKGAPSTRSRQDSAQSLKPLPPVPPTSPGYSRPETPVPSDITPWAYQKHTDIPQIGDAPIRSEPTEENQQDRSNSQENSSGHRSKHRIHLPHHRLSKSKEDKHDVGASTPNLAQQPRPNTAQDLHPTVRHLKEPHQPIATSSTTTLGDRAASPTPSTQSGSTRDGQRSPAPPQKRGLWNRMRFHPKDAFRSIPSAKPSQDPLRGPKSPMGPSSRKDSLENQRALEHGESERERKKELGKGLGIAAGKFRPGRRQDSEKSQRSKEDISFPLDLNLGDMSGIVKHPRPDSADAGGIFTGSELPDNKDQDLRNALDSSAAGDWHAPESWVVKKAGDDIVSRLAEFPEMGSSKATDEEGHPYCVRVFRIDSTFATLSSGLNTTAADILEMLGRKSFLQDDLNNYDIVMRKNDLSRALDLGEHPILTQKRLLHLAGYQESDRIADIGREDNSYLCRFTFLPTKLTGYSSLDSDPGFNKHQKFTHVDLQGKSLVTIPLVLYSKSHEIVSLNLSRNLALDVPKDFIQSCTNLREIKFASNEAWRLPASFSLASKLTFLDVSNNGLEQLEHAELDKLPGLISLKLANNMLSSLPTYFGQFACLRVLNLSSNSLHEFPGFLCNLTSLIDLDIGFNQISALPNIGKLRTLERLWVANNQLSGPLNNSFRELVHLKEFDARFNQITDISNLTKLPRLEVVQVGHNAVSSFSGSFIRLRHLVMDHCPVTEFDLTSPLYSLHTLNIASAKLVQFKDTLFANMPNLMRLILNKNHFVSLSPFVGFLRKLEHFTIAKNPLSSLPPTIGCLPELKSLNIRECNLSKLPPEIWYCSKLETLNVSSNVLNEFPKPASSPPELPSAGPVTTPTTPLPGSPGYEDLAKLDSFEARRPSQTSGSYLSVAGSDGRKGSVASQGGTGPRKASGGSYMDGMRKDSTFSQRLAGTFAMTLRSLCLGDNRLEDDIFHQIVLLVELRVLNLSYNGLTELPTGLLKRWQNLTELYLSGNELSALPSDDLEESSNLRVLHINANKFQVLPAELCKVNKLAILDVGSNSLKYNVSNWPYDWNWNWNHNLKYLNFSGNKRFEIKPHTSYPGGGAGTVHGADLTNFSSLNHIRVLGLMDVTLTIPTIPDQTENRRVRTAASLSGSISYGMADTLGKNDNLSMIDMVVPKYQGNEMETIIGLFDGEAQMSGGSKISKFLHENFSSTFGSELSKLRTNKGETPCDALRRTFLALNKEMATAAYKSMDDGDFRAMEHSSRSGRLLNQDDLRSGGVATILYLQNMELYVANVGEATAVLVQSSGEFKYLTQNHDPADPSERERIRAAGGYVSRNGKLNDTLSVSRAFGYYNHLPAVMAAPSTTQVTLSAQDEMIIMATKELWDYVTPDVVVDVARAERGDLMIASQKLRDLAISYGATNKIMVMIAGVSELKRRERNKFRGPSLSMGPSALDEHFLPTTKRIRRPRDAPGDSRLARLNHVEPPTGEMAIIFTDIRKSTELWESHPVAMRSAIQIHNELFRRQLSIIGGYEVKTEGDAFMVSFATPSSALLWCFTCQNQLLEAPWPREILESTAGREIFDGDENLIYRGLSVRMGVHWGRPVCEKDPVTGRMDYFGPMVNRASRISAVADGGQVLVSSDFITELLRTLESYSDVGRTGSAESEEVFSDESGNSKTRRELYQISSQGFEIKDLGERKLKGLENPEPVYLMYPHALAGRLLIQPETTDEGELLVPQTIGKDSKLNINADDFWRLMKVALRLEAFCSALEDDNGRRLQEPDLGLINTLKASGADMTDTSLLNLFEHQIARIELCITTLSIRQMMRPFKRGDTFQDHVAPIESVLQNLRVQLAEFKAFKDQANMSGMGTPTTTTMPGPGSESTNVPYSGMGTPASHSTSQVSAANPSSEGS